MSISENVTLGSTPTRHGIVAAGKCSALAEEAMSLVGLGLDPAPKSVSSPWENGDYSI